MAHVLGTYQDTEGNVNIGYRVRLLDKAANTVIPIFADDAGTPIETVSGITNQALTSQTGRYDFYVSDGDYNIEFMTPTGQGIEIISDVPYISASAVSAPDSFSSVTGDPTDNIPLKNELEARVPKFDSLAELKNAPLASTSAVYDGSTWRIFDAADYADAILVDDGEAYIAQSTTDILKVWVRDGREPFLVDTLHEAVDGLDYSPAFNKAFALGALLNRGVECGNAARYNIFSSVDIYPTSTGWTPPLFGNYSTILLGPAVPTISHEQAGFHIRGIKSNTVQIPITSNSTNFFANNLTIDAQSIAFSNGVRGFHLENASGWKFDNVNGENYSQGYHIVNHRYADGGAIGEKLGIVENCDISGNILAAISEPNWFGYSDGSDLQTVGAGGTIVAGEEELIAMPNATLTGVGIPRVSTPQIWANATGSDIVVPSVITEANLIAAGLTENTVLEIGGEVVSAPVYIYYSTGSQKTPFAEHQSRKNVVRNTNIIGGRYGVYVQGTEGHTLERVVSSYATRGIVGEWSARKVKFDNCEVYEPLSSAYLLGYGCSDGNFIDCYAEAATDRWVGEALFNIQLGSPGLTGRGNRTSTRDNVTTGQFHLHIAAGCDDADFEIHAKGDCSKAYICIASGLMRGSGVTIPTEAYEGGGPGASSTDMSNVRITGSIVPETTKAETAGATMVALIQAIDGTFGELALTNVNLHDLDCGRNKKPGRYIFLYQGADPAKYIRDCSMVNVRFPTEINANTAVLRMVLPDKWGHFRKVSNVDNMDDGVERFVIAGTTPDLTFGKFWFDTQSAALNGITGGQGYEDREIFVRSNGGRVWTTTSGAIDTKDGLRLTGSPVSFTATERLHLTFSPAIISWIGGVT